jgi:hypothetical protein
MLLISLEVPPTSVASENSSCEVTLADCLVPEVPEGTLVTETDLHIDTFKAGLGRMCWIVSDCEASSGCPFSMGSQLELRIEVPQPHDR